MNPNFNYIDEATKTQPQEQPNQDGQQKQHYSSVEATEFQVQQQQTAIKQLESNQYYNQIINPIKIQKNQQQWQAEITKQLQVKCLSLELLEKTFNKTEQEILNVVKGKVFVFNGYMFLRSKYLLEDEVEQAIRDSLLMIAAGCMNEELKIGKFTGGQINRIKYQESTKVSPYTFYRMCQEQDLFTVNPLDDNVIFNFNNDIDDDSRDDQTFLQSYRTNECIDIVRKLETIKQRCQEAKKFEKFHIQLIE